MRIRNSAAAKRAGVVERTLRRWDDDPEVGYPKPKFVKGRIYRELEAIIDWEQQNPDFGPPKKKQPVKQAKPSKQPKRKVKDKAERERAIARRDKRQQGLPGIGGPQDA